MSTIWVASYPRSGNTLLRTILHDVFGRDTTSLYPPPDVGADVQKRLGYVPLSAALRTDLAFVKTHDLPHGNDPAIYLYRDGRCAIMSYLYYVRVFTNIENLDFSAIAQGQPNGVNWSEHIRAWRGHGLHSSLAGSEPSQFQIP